MIPRLLAEGRTRVKLCGFTREEDVDAAVALDVDALGVVLGPRSPRASTPARAAALAARVPPAIGAVALFVDPTEDEVRAALARVPFALLQFHGDETPAFAASFGVPWIKAARVGPGVDLLDFAARHAQAPALMLDTASAGYGGSGQPFDWSLVPPALTDRARIILSGGLSAMNVGTAIARVAPHAVDVSSGIEADGRKGVKDAAAMRAFVNAVRAADART